MTKQKIIIPNKIKNLPVKFLEAVKQGGCKIITYKEFAQKINKPLDYILKMYDEKGFVFWSNLENCFIVCYNSDLPISVCRWTLMHEVAHIILGHVQPTNPTIINISQSQLLRFEHEANVFVQYILSIEQNNHIKKLKIKKVVLIYVCSFFPNIEKHEWVSYHCRSHIQRQSGCCVHYV